MASEHRSEYVSLPLVRSEPFQFFTGAATAVIEQDRRKRAAALGAPEQRVQRDRPVVHYDGFRPARRLALGLVASADVRTSAARMNTHGLVIRTYRLHLIA